MADKLTDAEAAKLYRFLRSEASREVPGQPAQYRALTVEVCDWAHTLNPDPVHRGPNRWSSVRLTGTDLDDEIRRQMRQARRRAREAMKGGNE